MLNVVDLFFDRSELRQREGIEAGGKARTTLIHEDHAVGLQRFTDPPALKITGARGAATRASLHENDCRLIRVWPVLIQRHLAGKQFNLTPIRVGVVQRYPQAMFSYVRAVLNVSATVRGIVEREQHAHLIHRLFWFCFLATGCACLVVTFRGQAGFFTGRPHLVGSTRISSTLADARKPRPLVHRFPTLNCSCCSARKRVGAFVHSVIVVSAHPLELNFAAHFAGVFKFCIECFHDFAVGYRLAVALLPALPLPREPPFSEGVNDVLRVRKNMQILLRAPGLPQEVEHGEQLAHIIRALF